MMVSMNKKISIIGSGGHALSLVGCLSHEQINRLYSIVSKDPVEHDQFIALKRFSSDEQILVNCEPHNFVLGVGAHPKTALRENLYNLYQSRGFTCETIISDKACIHHEVKIDAGVQIFPSSTINIGTKIGINSIINTGVIVEHGTFIGKHCHIAPGAIILGDAVIRDNCFIGAGTVVLPSVEVGKGSIVGAGIKVRNDLTENSFLRYSDEN